MTTRNFFRRGNADSAQEPAKKPEPNEYDEARDALVARRYHLAPAGAVGATWLAGEMLAQAGGDVWMYPALAGAGLLGASYVTKIAKPVMHWLNVNSPGVNWARATVAAGTGWLTAAAAITGPVSQQGVMALALLTGGTIASLPWWIRHRTTIGAPLLAPVVAEPVMEPVAAERPVEETLAIEPPQDWTWNNKITAKNGPLAGATLDDLGWRDVEHGRSAGVWLPEDASILMDEALTRVPRITQMYRKRLGTILVEPHEDHIEGHLRVTILDTTPIEDTRMWGGPCLDPVTGIMPLGPFADGKGEAMIQLFEAGIGMKHVLISGGTGAGKSILMANIIASIEHSGVGVVWFADPQNGQSIPEWANQGALDRVALDMEEIRIMVKAAHAAMLANSAYAANLDWVDDKGRQRHGKNVLEPSREMPFLALVIDEAHRVLRDAEIAALVADIAKMGRKAGVLLILATQTPSLEELGNSAAIRDNVTMGNVIILRTKSRITGSMLAVPVDPSRLPSRFPGNKSTNGIGFVIGYTDRPVMMRVDFEDDHFQWASTRPGTKLAESTRRAAEIVFENPDIVIGGDGASAPISLKSMQENRRGMEELGKLLEFPSAPKPMDVPSSLEGIQQAAQKAAREAEAADSPRAKARILDYLAQHGPAFPTRISRAVDISEGHIYRVLKELMDRQGDGLPLVGREVDRGYSLYDPEIHEDPDDDEIEATVTA